MTTVTRRSILKAGLAAPILMATAQSASAATHQVEIVKFKFKSAKLSVNVGDTVRFTNKDGAPHTATANNGSFNTGKLSKGKSGDVTFSKAGKISYYCKYHPNMKGVITVSG